MWLYSPSRGGGNSRMSANTGTSPCLTPQFLPASQEVRM
ncbi:WSSV338 [White spot syndrome virus]|uniref:WSSV338 n=1 Tax=White spot syndrome virus TaxID=342409 RepID=A0A2I6SC34_9VIRU|nr:WSSV338 [White spot syndrome virus]